MSKSKKPRNPIKSKDDRYVEEHHEGSLLSRDCVNILLKALGGMEPGGFGD